MVKKMTIEFPDELHSDLKVAAARQKTTIKAILIRCAEKYVQKQSAHTDTPKPDKPGD